MNIYKCAILCVALNVVSVCMAQSDTVYLRNENFDDVELDEVVVTSNREETKKHLAPSVVQVLNNRKLELTRSCVVADALPFQAGVRVEDDCQNCGYKQARINGLDGHYSQILINSHPMFSAVSNLYGLEQIPANMIGRVEVMRGGGSALYGASAVGGTINIITKEPERNSADVSHTFSALENSSFDNNTTLNASVLTPDKKAGISIFAQNRIRQGYSYYDDGYTTLPQLKTQSVGTNLYFKTSSYSKLSFDYYLLKDDRRGGNDFDSIPEKSNIAETAQHTIHNGTANYYWSSQNGKYYFNLYSGIAYVNRNSYTGGYGTDEDPDLNADRYYSKTNDLTWALGGLYRYKMDTCWFLPADLTVGGEYTGDHIDDYAIGFDTREKQRTGIGSLYAQNEWKNHRWGFLLGLRMDKHNLIDHPIFSPRVNLRYSPNEKWSFRATYSDGFRAPQIFDEDLHIEMAAGNRFKVYLADDLKEERSHSYTISSDLNTSFGKTRFEWMMEGFLTDLNDIFAERETGIIDEQGNEKIERYNGSGAKVMGITTELRTLFPKYVTMELSFTAQKSEYDELEHWSDEAPDVKRMFRSPNLYGYMDVDVTPVKNFTIGLSGTYTGSMLVQHLAGSGTDVDVAVETPNFWDFNVKLNYSFLIQCVKVDVSTGVKNLFNSFQKDLDRGAERDGAYIYGPSLPRNFFAGLSIHL